MTILLNDLKNIINFSKKILFEHLKNILELFSKSLRLINIK